MGQIYKRDITDSDRIFEIFDDISIYGNISSKAYLRCFGNIFVYGNVESAKVVSVNGDIYIEGDVIGKDTYIEAFGNITLNSALDAKLNAGNCLYVNSFLKSCNVRVNNTIEFTNSDAVISGGRASAGNNILGNVIGSIKKDETEVVLEEPWKNAIYNDILFFSERLNEFIEELKRLEKVIKVIKLLGDNVTRLPDDKKAEMAMKVKRYKELKTLANNINIHKNMILLNYKPKKNYMRIIMAKDHVFPNVTIRIDNSVLSLNKLYKKVVFYKRGIIIAADIESYNERLKYGNF